jgi:DNA-binding transcriptional MocR family regulator
MASERIAATSTDQSDARTERPRETLYALLAEEIRQQIRSGVFLPEQKLPSVRELSRLRKVSINTVQEAYRQLEDSRWIVVRSQSGAYVLRDMPDHARSTDDAGATPGNIVMRYLAQTGPAAEMAYRDDLIPFGAAVPDASFFPCDVLANSITRLLKKKPALIGTYNFSPGSPELRQQIASRHVDWGANIDPKRVVITNGAVEAIQLSLRAVTKPGDAVAVEGPAYYGFLQLLQSLCLRIVTIPNIVGEGFNVDALELALKETKITAVLLSTTVSNPTGDTMPLQKKRQLVDLAVRHQIAVIEDATFSDMHFEGDSIACQSLDESGLFILCASLTKTIAPGMRIGWVDGGRFSEEIRFLKRVSSIGQPAVMELALADYFARGGMRKHLRKIRADMKSQVIRMAADVIDFFPAGTSVTMPSGGFLLWVELPSQIDALQLQERAVEYGVGIAPGILFSARGDYKNFMRLNCGVVDSLRTRNGLKALAQLTAAMT